jgi:hypothetical protein
MGKAGKRSPSKKIVPISTRISQEGFLKLCCTPMINPIAISKVCQLNNQWGSGITNL